MKQAPVLTDRDKQRVLQHIARSSYSARNRCMIQLSWLAGMRVGEIAALNIGDVIGLHGEVRSEIQLKAAQTKGDKARTVLLSVLAALTSGPYFFALG
ncbi:MAG: integrase [Hyphomicrobiales bacterium]|nr:integrase [Hyphomicrobiales bacterium]